MKAIKFLLIMTVICGIVYTGAITLVAQIFFPEKANGSIIEVDGKKYGSALLAQHYTDDAHMWGRVIELDISTFVDESGKRLMYGAPSNLSPASAEYEELIAMRVTALAESNPQMAGSAVPVDLVTCSGSGLDPHISPAAAKYQVARLANANDMTESDIAALIEKCTSGRFLGVFGEKTVNVLKFNLMLDGILE